VQANRLTFAQRPDGKFVLKYFLLRTDNAGRRRPLRAVFFSSAAAAARELRACSINGRKKIIFNHPLFSIERLRNYNLQQQSLRSCFALWQ